MSKQLTHVVGTFLIQAEGAFLNGAGKESYGEGEITIPKTIKTLNENGSSTAIPYVSSQSWKRWLRDTFLEENPEIKPNPILATDVNKKGNPNKVGSEVDPIEFAEADIFGFMKSEKRQGKTKEIVDFDDSEEGDEDEGFVDKGKEKVKPAIRTSPFQSSILISLRKTGWEGIDNGYVNPKGISKVVYKRILDDLIDDKKVEKQNLNVYKKLKDIIYRLWEDKSETLSLDELKLAIINQLRSLKDKEEYKIIKSNIEGSIDNIEKAIAYSLPYNTKFYDTQLQGIFGLAYSRLGVFRCEGDRIELLPEFQNKHKEKLDEEKTKTGSIFKMKNNPRKDRATKIIKALSVMRGGAKQAQFGTPVHPQVLILAGLTSGNLIFNNLFDDTSKGPKIKIETLEEIIKDFSERIVTKVYIGIRTGYLQPENEAQLKEWAKEHKEVVVCTPIEAASNITEGLPA